MAITKDDITHISDLLVSLEASIVQNQKALARTIVANQDILLKTMKVIRGYVELLAKQAGIQV
jgi:hypothetical protein